MKLLEKRSFKTYQARLRASERLAARSGAWNASMIALSTSTALASIGILFKRDMYGHQGDALLAIISILTLVASLVVSNMNYGGRAESMRASYKRIQQISLQAESFFADKADSDARRYRELCHAYEVALENSENHTTADFKRSENCRWWKVLPDTACSSFPWITLIIPVLLMWPIAAWLIDG
ncbi:SLATT domain-containing protein [Kineosporia rhizophila]|uniref:SLATT domain-containing protein n=1 Tax=Kineosporia rhizophila TaxID=84633 RepID=UPI001E3FA6D5|nr:SLATT domain-containing protein [Kineosporia rhizophila]